MKQTKPKVSESWEIVFDAQFYHEYAINDHPCEALVNNYSGKCNCQLADIKTFIQKELDQQKQEMVEKLREVLLDSKFKANGLTWWNQLTEEEVDDIIKRLGEV